jgi:hypothetical protein
MLQSEFEYLSDLFDVEGLESIANLNLPEQEMAELAMHLQELNFYAQQHMQVETEIGKIAESDKECRVLMSHPDITPLHGGGHQGQDRRRLEVPDEEAPLLLRWRRPES